MIKKIELENTNKLLEEAGIDPIDVLPEEKKARWNAKRIGLAALVTVAALGYYFTRPSLPLQQKKEIKAGVSSLGNDSYAFYYHGNNGDNIKIFSQGQLEYDLYDYDSDGKVDEIFSPPVVYVRRGYVLPPCFIQADIFFEAADGMWKVIKENLQ